MEIKDLQVGVTNCYLIGSGKPYLLVDTGYVENWNLLCKGLKKVGVSWKDISFLLLTHHHDDHCGSLNHALRENPHIGIILSKQAKDLLLAGKNSTSPTWCINRRVKLFISLLKIFDQRWRLHLFPPYQTRATDILVAGETSLRDLGMELDGKIIPTPGHSPDSISILFADGNCIVGDAAANFPPFLETKYCVILIEDLETYYQNWQKLISAGARQIFPAHGKPFSGEKLAQNIGKITREQMVALH